VELPSSGERAKARRGGSLYPCASRERRITHPNSDANTRSDAPVPKARLVRRRAAVAALHPNTRPNGAARERLTEPVADRYADGDSNRNACDTNTRSIGALRLELTPQRCCNQGGGTAAVAERILFGR
jgi:hypothetical protein